jgi:hypothetical protein
LTLPSQRDREGPLTSLQARDRKSPTTPLPPRRDQRHPLNTQTRKRILITYAAIGPILLWSLYTVSRDRGLVPALERLNDVVLFVAVASGAYCAFRGLPGHRLVRAGVALVYAVCMTYVVLLVALSIECAHGKCL